MPSAPVTTRISMKDIIGTDLSREAIIQAIETELHGVRISSADAPLLYACMGRMFDDCVRAHEKLVPGFSVSELVLMDSMIANGMLMEFPREDGETARTSIAFVSTAMIRRFLRPGMGAEEFQREFQKLMGVLLHELGHVVASGSARDSDFLGGYASYFSQKSELEADIAGTLVAHEADYPADVVLESRKAFSSTAGKGSYQKIAETMVSTHPPSEVAITGLRLVLTALRLKFGSPNPTPKWIADIPFNDVLAELQGIRDFEEKWQFVWPQTVEEATSRLQALARDEGKLRGDSLEAVEFQRLVIALDSLLVQFGANLQPDELRSIREWFETWTQKRDLPLPLVQEDIVRSLGDWNGSEAVGAKSAGQRIPKKQGHGLALRNVPFYRQITPAWVREQIEFVPGNGSRNLAELRRRQPFLLMPMGTLLDEFGPELLSAAVEFGPLTGWKPGQINALAGCATQRAFDWPDCRDPVALIGEIAFRSFLERGEPAGELFALICILQKSDVETIWREQAAGGKTAEKRKAAAQFLLIHQRLNQQLWNDRGNVALWNCVALNAEGNGLTNLLGGRRTVDLRQVGKVVGEPAVAVPSKIRSEVRKLVVKGDFAGFLERANAVLSSSREESKKIGAGYFPSPPRRDGAFFWVDRATSELLAHHGASSTAVSLAERKIAELIGQVFPESFRTNWKKQLDEAFEKTHTADELLERIGNWAHMPETEIMATLLLDATLASNWDEGQKRVVLERVFGSSAVSLRTSFEPTWSLFPQWLTQLSAEGLKKLSSDLQGQGLFPDLLTFVESVQADVTNPSQRRSLIGVMLLRGLAPVLQDFLASDASPETLLRVARLVNALLGDKNPAPDIRRRKPINPLRESGIRELQLKLLEIAEHSSTPPDVREEVFLLLSESGGTPELDVFFSKQLRTTFEGDRVRLFEMLKQSRFLSDSLRVSLAEQVLEDPVRDLEARANELYATGQGGQSTKFKQEVSAFFSVLEELAENPSTQRETLLEAYAWRLGLSGKDLQGMVEERKSHNYKKIHPALVNAGSGVVEFMSSFNKQDRLILLESLMDPNLVELPEPVRQTIRKCAEEATFDLNRKDLSIVSPTGVSLETAEGIAASVEQEMTLLIRDFSPMERIPLMEVLMSAGPNNLESAPNFPGNIFRNFLNIQPHPETGKKTAEERYLVAYLESVPPHEITVTLAYLMARKGESGVEGGNGSATRAVFEAFGTVGVKFGQLAGTLEIFGPEVTEELKGLKEHAQAMSKFEIEKILKETLSTQEKAMIRRPLRIVGSASLKTVVEVELMDGTVAVVLVKSHNADRLIQSNLDFGRNFLAKIKEDPDSELPVALFENLMLSLEEQLQEETIFSLELDKTERARSMFETFNREMAKDLNGWKFSVPKRLEDFAVHENVMFMEYARGVSWDELTQAQQQALGPSLVEASLAMMFEHGDFDPDRHKGNWRFEPETKTIYPLDFGQLEQLRKSKSRFTSDDGFVIARTLQAIDEGKAKPLVDLAMSMARPGTQLQNRQAMEEDLARTLAEDVDIKKKMLNIISVWADHGVFLQKKFFLGAFKGLAVLAGENYISDADFKVALEPHIRSVLRRKLPHMVIRAAQNRVRRSDSVGEPVH